MYRMRSEALPLTWRRARRLCRRVLGWLRGPHDVVCSWQGFRFRARSDSVLANLAQRDVGFETAEVSFVRRILRPGSQAVDAGANIGFYTMVLARAVGPNGHVWSFEPFSPAATYLRSNLELNGIDNVTLVEKALGNREGVADFHVFPDGQDVYNSLGARERPAERLRAARKVAVPVTTLDTLADSVGIAEIDFMKVDVEGAEELVIRGGQRLIRRSRNLVMLVEMYQPSAAQCGCSTERLAALLGEWGFSLHTVGPRGETVPASLADVKLPSAVFARPEILSR